VIEAVDREQALDQAGRLREALPGGGIIAVPDAVGPPRPEMVASLGIDDVLSKPVNAGLLLARVAELLKPKG
jgi:DNA-binding response OmpR family regulator